MDDVQCIFWNFLVVHASRVLINLTARLGDLHEWEGKGCGSPTLRKNRENNWRQTYPDMLPHIQII